MELITLAQERYSQLSNEIEGKSLARQESVTIEDICRYPLAGFGGELYPPEIAVDSFEKLQMEKLFQHAMYRFNNLDNIKSIVSKGLAVAVLPRKICQRDRV